MNTQPMTKVELRKALGDCSDAELARFFKITPAAVSQWPDDQPIPRLRWLEVGHLRPDLFGPSAASGEAA